MKLDIKTLTKMIKEEMSILKEKSGTGRMGGTYAGKKRQGQHDRMTAVSDFETHKDTEPEKSAERTVYDKSKWIHPYSDVTHTVGDDGQPKSGWKYRQATTTTSPDLSKWTHPFTKSTTTLSKGQTQPAKGWQYRQATTTPGKTDTSRWIHPYKLGDKGTITPKGQKQPEVGWTYAQAPTDFSKYIHPYSGQTIDVPKLKKGDDFKIGDKIADFDDERALAPGKSKAQPEYGWEISNIPKIGEKIPEAPKTLSQKDWQVAQKVPFKTPQAADKAYQTYQTKAAQDLKTYNQKFGKTYGQGSMDDYKKVPMAIGKQKSIPKKTTNPFNLLGKGSVGYGSGTEQDYDAMRRNTTLGRSKYTAPKKITNPKGPDVTSYATKYGQGATSDYSTVMKGAGRDQGKIGATTNPTKTDTSYATQYSQGGPSDYSADQQGTGRDQFTVPKVTKNPSSQETYTTDAWIDWKGKFDDLQQSVSDAESAMKDAEAKMKQTNGDKLAVKASEKPGSNMGRGGVVVGTRGSRGGAKSKGGFGSGKSAGKGKGKGKKGKKKDESLFRILGRDLIKEFNEIKKYTK